ncbi:isopeptide-forming domain-containing fimbrial protein, partial [Virgibacillus sp. W0430]|uniref:isopeptide-forming domain-containing fimbrial protein n=1 Tax=Virgibacillus sp. W0430 TaxID=3391580 RepID=UPI003F47F2DF
MTAGKEEIGTYRVTTDGKVNVTVNDESRTPMNGSFSFETTLNKELIKEREIIPVQFHLKESTKSINVPLETEADSDPESADVNQSMEETNNEHGQQSSLEAEQYEPAQEQKTSEGVRTSNAEVKMIKPMNASSVQTTLTQESTKLEHYTNEEMVHEVKLTISGTDTTFTNSVIKMEMPGIHVDTLEVGDLDSISQVEYKTESDKRVAYVHLKPLGGGTILSFPVRTKFKEKTTPEGYELMIGAAFLDDNDEIVAEANPVNFKSKYDKPPHFSKRLNDKQDNNQAIYAGKSEGENVTEDEKYLVEIPFTFFFNTNMNNAIYRKMEKATIVDTLPPFAQFDPGKNPGWTYNSIDNTVTKVFEGPFQKNSDLIDAINAEKLRLTFPGAKLSETYTNSVQVTLEPEGKPDYEQNTVLEDDITYTFDDKLSTGFFTKSSPYISNIIDNEYGKSQLQDWTLMVNNTTTMEMRNIVIEETIANVFGLDNADIGLDSRMMFDHLKLDSNSFENSMVELIAIVGDTEQVIEKTGDTFVFPEHTKSFKLKIDKMAAETINQKINLFTKIKNPEEVHYDEANADNNVFRNTATVKSDFMYPNQPDEGVSVVENSTSAYQLTQTDERIGIVKNITENYQKDTYLKGDEIQYVLRYAPSYKVDPNRILPNAKFIDLLPNGLTPSASGNYEIVENYKDSGRTAIIYELGDINASEAKNIYVKAIVNKYSEEDLNTNDLYFVYDGEQLPIRSDLKKAQDKYDLNDNGNTEEFINYANANYNYLQGKEVIATKYIKNKDQNSGSTIGIGTEEGAEFDYRLNIKNYLDKDLDSLVLYDILPYKDDKTIIKNQDGIRTARGSNFNNFLDGPVVAPTGYTVYYSIDPIIENEIEAVNNGNWSQSVSDYSKVNAIKIEMNADTLLASRAEVDFTVPMKAPEKWALKDGEKAYNSFAYSTNDGQSFLEANKVFNEMDIPERIMKDVNGENHIKIEREKEYKYNVLTQIPEDIKDYEKFSIIDEVDSGLSVISDGVIATVDGQSDSGLDVNVVGNKVTVTVTDFAGLTDKKQIELVIPAKINNDTNINEYVDGNISNTAILNFKHKNSYESSKETNSVTVTPEGPSITKDVNGKENLVIDRDNTFSYNVVTMLPKDIKDYERLVITDQVDSGLDVIQEDVKVTVDGSSYEGLEITVVDNEVTANITDFSGLDGKSKVELVIPAKIKGSTDISTYTDNKIPNIAKIDFIDVSGENKSKVTKPVTVTPPKTPEIVKNVEGKENLEIEKGEDYHYNVTAQIPTNLEGFESLKVIDTLDDRLNVVGAKVFVDGEASSVVAEITGQTVAVSLDRQALNDIAGKELHVQITAKIKAGVEIEPIDNTATVQLNDNPSVASNTVTVVPPAPKAPSSLKDVEGHGHLEIGKGEEYTYNIRTVIPEDLGGYDSLKLADTLDDRLNVVGAKVFVDGEASSVVAEITGQTVAVSLDRQALNDIAGKELHVQITAKIKAGVEIEPIDNTATVQLNDNPSVASNTVTVVP